MAKKAVFGMMLILLLTGILTLTFTVGTGKATSYYYNFLITITPESPTTYDEVYARVSLDTASISYNVTFGSLSRAGNYFFTSVDIYVPSIYLPAIGNAAKTYDLGRLPEGSYSLNVNVRVWYRPTGQLLDLADNQSSFIIIAYSPMLSLETSRYYSRLGENVTIVLKNIGTQTVNIGGYPAWQIYTYPEEAPVFPEIFATLSWSLNPGENDTFEWNQYNQFNQSFCAIGTYIVKDNQGWGISEYFSIEAQAIVPDDYPTIQSAINLANEGDMIFVRNGTYYEHIVVDKTVSLIGESPSTTIINGNGTGTVIYINASDVRIGNFAIRNSGVSDLDSGISLFHSNNSTISGNTITNNGYGVFAYFSNSSAIQDNSIRDNGVGVHIEFSRGNDISGNIIFHNGIGLDIANYPPYPVDQFSNNIVSKNRIENNTSDGIHVRMTINSTFIENDIIGNGYGVDLFYTSGLTFCHNNFINNTIQAETYQGANDVWGNGCEGNYWSDYNGTDIDGDGVGETYLPWQAVDGYPLMNRYWNPTDINHDLKVDIKDLATAALAYGSYVGYERWNPHADITGPEYLVPDGKVDIRDLALMAKHYGETRI